MDTELKPDSRAARFVGFTITSAAGVLWTAQHFGFVPQPWQVIRFLCKDLWGIAWQARYPDYQFAFNGHVVTPGWYWFSTSLHYVAGSWKSSLTVAVALFIGGIVAIIMDKLVKRWYAQTMRSIK